MLDHLHECDRAYVTTNSFVKKDGSLVMGRGIAKQVKEMFPGIDADFGFAISSRGKSEGFYGTLSHILHPKIRAFQVKYHWAAPAEYTLIRKACEFMMMDKDTDEALENKQMVYFLNFPGIGNGRLKREAVLPLIEKLPDSVHVWEFEESH